MQHRNLIDNQHVRLLDHLPPRLRHPFRKVRRQLIRHADAAPAMNRITAQMSRRQPRRCRNRHFFTHRSRLSNKIIQQVRLARSGRTRQ